MPEVLQLVKDLSHESIVYLISFLTDKSGNTFSFESSCALISQHSTGPIYSHSDVHLEHGIVGGLLNCGDAQGQMAGEMALRILHGEKVKDIPVVKKSPLRYKFDYLQMQRFGIDLSSLPEGSTVINRPHSLYSEHKALVLSSIAGVASLVLIILVLSANTIIRRRAENSLRESEQRFREMADLLPTIIAETDLDSHVTYANRAGFETFGYSQADIDAGFSVIDAVHPDEKERVLKDMKKVTQGEKIAGEEYRMLRKDGSELSISVHSSPIYKNGKIIGVRSNLVDITERKQAEEALRESEEKYRSLVDSTEDSIYLVDRDRRYLFMNEKYLSRLCLLRDKVTGRSYSEFHSKKETKEFAKRVNEVFKTGKSLPYEYGSERDGGYYIRTLSPVKEPDERIRAVTVVSKNITSLKKAEEKIKASLKEKELLLQEIHHRVKNNMQVISSLLKLQAETIQDERLCASFRDSEHRVRAMSLVHEKLYQSKDFTHIPFKDYLTSLIRYLYQSYTPQARNIELSSEIEELPLTITHAIPCGLIVNELVSNALKHAFPEKRKGTITLSLRSPERDTIELSVTDNGISLPDDIDIHTTKTLGLHLVTILVEDQLKGEITVSRRKGTRFRIRFKKQQ
jgi:PAS domain S-box-containing protein